MNIEFRTGIVVHAQGRYPRRTLCGANFRQDVRQVKCPVTCTKCLLLSGDEAVLRDNLRSQISDLEEEVSHLRTELRRAQRRA